jgi:hypothetical protein
LYKGRGKDNLNKEKRCDKLAITLLALIERHCAHLVAA